MLLMDSPDDVTGPINLGNPGEYTVLELAEAIVELTGSNSSIIHQPLPADDPLQRQPDIGIARRTLGWEPTVPLRRGAAADHCLLRPVARVTRRHDWPGDCPHRVEQVLAPVPGQRVGEDVPDRVRGSPAQRVARAR